MPLVWELGKSISSLPCAALLLGVLAVACSGRSADTTPRSCAADADCAAGQRCAAPADRPVIGMAPCARAVLCSEADAACPADQLCAPSWQSLPGYPFCGERLCAAPCTDESCPADAECASNGLCELTRCDAPGAAACPEFWRCDPAAAATASHEPVSGTTTGDDTLELERHSQRGCVRSTCAEQGGFECVSAWSCKPDATTNPAGCIPDACGNTGHCSNDETLVCQPQAKHPDRGPLDLNGCVPATCDDGYSCSLVTEAGVDVGVCRYGAPNADYYGCVVLPCTTDDECFYDYVCDHASPQADERGCRQQSCTEGYRCPDGFVCDPKAVQHDGADCTTPEFATSGGASGSGAGGSGGSGAGGSGGSASKPPLRGQCVAR